MIKNVNIYFCPWCNKEVSSGRSFGAHKTNCRLNPKRAEISAKIITSKKKEQETITKICKCGKEFSFTKTIGSKYNKIIAQCRVQVLENILPKQNTFLISFLKMSNVMWKLKAS